MLGHSVPYTHIPVYRANSNPLGLHVTTIGKCDGDAETHSFWCRTPHPSSGASGNLGANGGRGGKPRKRARKDSRTVEGEAAHSAAHSGSDDPFTATMHDVMEQIGMKQKAGPPPPATPWYEVPVAPLTPAECKRKEGAPAKPIHGYGVVFYMAKDGKTVTGAAVWGLPSSTRGAKQSGDNALERMEGIEERIIEDVRSLMCDFNGEPLNTPIARRSLEAIAAQQDPNADPTLSGSSDSLFHAHHHDNLPPFPSNSCPTGFVRESCNYSVGHSHPQRRERA